MFDVHVRARAARLGQAVADGILESQCAEVRVLERVVGPVDRHGDAGVLDDDRLPGQLVGAGVERFGIGAGETADDDVDAAREARPEAGALGVRWLALKGDAAFERTNAREAKGTELVT